MHNSGVYRNYFMSHALSERFSLKSYVLTTDNVHLMAQDALPISDKIVIEPIYTLDYRTILAKWRPVNSNKGIHLKESNKSSKFTQFLIRLQRSFPFFLMLAEGSFFYIFNAYRKASKLVKTESITIVYSSFMPYADHIVAWALKRKYPHLVWVADFRDLHLEPIYKNTLWPSLQRWFEKKILASADIVTSVSDGLCDKLKAYHDKPLTITKGVTLRAEQVLFKQFTISYVGGLFRNFRDPRPIFKAIKKWREISKASVVFRYAGKDGAQMRAWANECGIEDIFLDIGYVGRSEASLTQDRSHINVLLTSSSDDHKGVLTGKLFDYIESRRPVLCSVNGVYDDELQLFFSTYSLGNIFYNNDEDAIVQYLDTLYREWTTTGNIISILDMDRIKNSLSWEGQASKILDAVQKVSASKMIL